jgi:hypothetical protein
MRLALWVSLYDTYKIIFVIPTPFLLVTPWRSLSSALRQSRQLAKDLPRGAIECLSVTKAFFAVVPPATVDFFLLTATMNAITELLVSATLEDATIGRSELRADDGF